MKNLKLLGYLTILVSGLVFIQCTSDPIEGPRGLDGTNGIDGINGADGTNGVDGVDGTASCIACHNTSHRAAIKGSYDLSGHAAGGAVGYAGSRGSCSRCHSEEGYVNWVTGMPAVNISDPSPVGCTTCHEKHSTFDFENDGHDYALRTMSPVTLITDNSYTIDFEGSSNMCVDCHQPRRTGPINDGNGFFMVTSSHWGPHHGPQSTFLEGIQGAHIVGSESYDAPMSAKHRTNRSCTECHMSADDGGGNGAHTFIVTDNGCTGCHSSGIPTEVTGFVADMATLKTLLENVEGWEYVYEEDADGDLVEDANGDPIMVLDVNGDPVTRVAHAIVHDDHPNNGSQGEGATFTIKEAQAAWNYLLLLEDSSRGIHNPNYAKTLLKNSIEALQ